MSIWNVTPAIFGRCQYLGHWLSVVELIDLLNMSSWCLVMVERLFLAVQRDCLQFVIVVFPDHTHLLFLVPPCEVACSYRNLLGKIKYIFLSDTTRRRTLVFVM